MTESCIQPTFPLTSPYAGSPTPTMRRAGAEGNPAVTGTCMHTVPRLHRTGLSDLSQRQPPILRAVDVSRPQEAASLQVADLVEHGQRMVRAAAEVAVIDRALLLAVGWTFGAVHVEDDALGRLALMHPVDPGAGQIHQRRQVDLARRPSKDFETAMSVSLRASSSSRYANRPPSEVILAP